MVNPFKYKSDPDPTYPVFADLTGEDFAMRVFYLLNQETAEQAVDESIQARQVSLPPK